jgi:hypothetical protein
VPISGQHKPVWKLSQTGDKAANLKELSADLLAYEDKMSGKENLLSKMPGYQRFESVFGSPQKTTVSNERFSEYMKSLEETYVQKIPKKLLKKLKERVYTLMKNI